MARTKTAPGRSAATEILKRHKAIRDIIDECHKEGRPVENSHILRRLNEMGIEIKLRQLQSDRTAINQESSFLSDLGESNYSAYMQEIMDDLDLIRKAAWEKYNAVWNTKKAKEKTVDGKKTTEKEVIENDAAPKARFLEIFLQCQNIKLSLLKGDNVDLAMDMLSKKLHTVKEERDGLKVQLEKARDEKNPS